MNTDKTAIDISKRTKEVEEVDRYITMLSKKGYDNSLEDQRKRVNAGVIIARNIYKTEINNHDKLIEALKPLANLDLTGVNGNTVYQRDKTKIMKQDVLTARELLKTLEQDI